MDDGQVANAQHDAQPPDGSLDADRQENCRPPSIGPRLADRVVHAATISRMVSNPTTAPASRCVCSNRIPPTHLLGGKVNMLYPHELGQSGTDMPA